MDHIKLFGILKLFLSRLVEDLKIQYLQPEAMVKWLLGVTMT